MYSRVEVKNDYSNELGVEVKGASYYISDAESVTAETAEKEEWPTNIGVGSRMMVIATGHIYIFGPSKKWVLYQGVSIMN